MPHYRTLAAKVPPSCGIDEPICLPVPEDPYDRPASRQTDGSSLIAIYNSNNDELPLLARDMEDPSHALDPRKQWPSIPSPNLRFAATTAWSRFLERYYHPVADNHIV